MSGLLGIWLIIGPLVGTPELAHAASAEIRYFNIPATTPSQALTDFARQAGVLISAPTGRLLSGRTRPLKGRYDIHTALLKLISGTGLEIALERDGLISLRFKFEPLKKQPETRTSSLPNVIIEKPITEVVVAGSRLPESLQSRSYPLASIPAEAISLSGMHTIDTLLNHLPLMVGTGGGGATDNRVPARAVSLNLRGLGPTRTLVLVNGRRFALSGSDQTIDLNAVPVSLIKRVDMVTGGSSAVYGSDAIAGVVNLVLRDKVDGQEVSVQTEWDEDTGTPSYAVDAVLGLPLYAGRARVVLGASFINRPEITREKKGGWASSLLGDGCVVTSTWSDKQEGIPLPVPATSTCAREGGRAGLIVAGSPDIPNGRFFGLPVFGSAQSNPALDATLLNAGLQTAGTRGFTFDDRGQTARAIVAPTDTYNYSPDNFLIIPLERYTLNALVHYDLSGRQHLFFEGHLSKNSTRMQYASANINGAFVIEVDNPYLPPSLQAVLAQLDRMEARPVRVRNGQSTIETKPGDRLAIVGVGRRLLEVGPRRDVSTRQLYRNVFGYWQEFDTGRLQASYTYSLSRNTEKKTGLISRTRFADGLLSRGSAPPLLNIFGQNLTPAAVKAIEVTLSDHETATQQVLTVDYSNRIGTVGQKAINYLLGFEWRRNSAYLSPDPQTQIDEVVGFPVQLATRGSVDTHEFYVEGRIPLLTHHDMLPSLSLTSALRYSHYDLKNIGGVLTHSLGLLAVVSSDVRLRAQVQRAIRAPNIAELYQAKNLEFVLAIDPCSERTLPTLRTPALLNLCVASGVPANMVFSANVQPGSLIGMTKSGNIAVGEETSDTLTFGLTYTPTRWPQARIDINVYRIGIKDLIQALGGGLQSTLNLCYFVVRDPKSDYCGAISRNNRTGEIDGPDYVSLPNTNSGGLRASGVDLDIVYEVNTPAIGVAHAGSLSFQSTYTYTHQYDLMPIRSSRSPIFECAGAYGLTCNNVAPRWKGITSLVWRTRSIVVSANLRHIGGVVRDTYLIPKRSGDSGPDKNAVSQVQLPAQYYVDLSMVLDMTERLSVSAGVRNLANKAPPLVGDAQLLSNTWPGIYDVLGRSYFITLSQRF